MRILVVHNEYRNRGGEDSVVRAEIDLLKAAGNTVIEYFRSNEVIEARSLVQKLRVGVNTIWNRESYREIREIVRRERLDVAHFHNTFPLISPAAYAACKEASLPVVQTVHNYRMLCGGGNLFRNGRPCEDCVGKTLAWPGVAHACYRGSRAATATVAAMNAAHRELGTWRERVDIFIAPSQFAREKLIAGGLPANKIMVKPHFVAPDPGCRAGNGDYAIYAGRLSEEKGLRTLLRAWKLSGARLVLRIVGDGPLGAKLKTETEELGLTAVEFAGALLHSETVAAIQSARFLIAPSECYETFSMAVAEAAACGVPAIASRHGALAEIVDDRPTGLLFTPSNAKDLAAAIDWACEHPEQLAEMGRAARARYEAEFTAERNLPQLMAIYERAIEQNSSVAAGAMTLLPIRAEKQLSNAVSPKRSIFSVLGVRVDATQIPDMIGRMKQWIAAKDACRMIAVTGMHGVMEAQHDAGFRDVLGDADAVVPDGMPLVWLARLRGCALKRRVYGPELMFAFCERTAGDGFRHFFYGGAPGQAEKLAAKLQAKFPGLQIAGTYSPPFRELTAREDEEISAMINEAAPDVVWVGLGTPKQERWMHEHREKLNASVMAGVGAAFDIHSGAKTQAPEWMREHGFEWLYRLVQEPRRLWRRYLVYGSEFVVKVGLELIGIGKKAHAR